MEVASAIVVVSTGLLAFYFHTTCQKVLRREFDRPYFQLVVDVNRLEFPSLRKALEGIGTGFDYPRVWLALKCDYAALAYLLKRVAKAEHHYSGEEWLLVIYSRLLFLSVAWRHRLRLRVQPAALKLVAVLEYFANVVGQRVSARAGSLAPSG